LHALALAAVGVLLWHPPSIITAGFWLSFGAVLTILAALKWTAGKPRWLTAGVIQLALTLALWPVLSVFALPASSAAPLVNLLLVPLFGLLVVPVALLGAVLLMAAPALGSPLLLWLGGLLDRVQEALAALIRLPWPELTIAGSGPAPYLAVGIAAVFLLAPPGFPLRRLAPALLCIPWLPPAPEPKSGAFLLHLLDVGQGLSVVVETRHHTLVFDTGPEFPSGFSTAEAVLLPFLAKRGRSWIDRLVVSHGDMDHSGGIDRVLERIPVSQLISGEPERVGFAARRCVAGEHWTWEGVRFEFLHPPGSQRLGGNDASCVLLIDNAAGRVLLTGDIEEPVERRLVLADRQKLRAEVVVAPHHGSRSSSSAPFVAATSPRYVVYTAGWANRYGFPAETVDGRWRDSGAIPLNTANLGAIRFEFTAEGRIEGPYAHRREAGRFWWHDSGSAAPPHAVSSADRSGQP
jgi:competence protein ComEC